MIIGITGNTGVGKTEVSKFFKNWGATIISCDEIGWEVLKESFVVEKIKSKFEGVTTEDGKINREKLASIVFKDKKKLQELNKIVHPELLRRLKEAIEKERNKIIVVDAALIFEWKIKDWFDFIILVISTTKNKYKRLLAQGIEKGIIKGRLNSQLESRFLTKLSDFVIENNGTLKELEKKAREVWNKILEKKKN
ncbi:MAG: dephospho-CoA kinase [candidate division WOR-3 bacterium]